MEDLKIENKTSFLECSVVMIQKEQRDYEGKHITLLNLVKKQLEYGESNNDFHNADWAIQQDLYINSTVEIKERDKLVNGHYYYICNHYKEWYIGVYNGKSFDFIDDNGNFHPIAIRNCYEVLASTRDLRLEINEGDDLEKISYRIPNISIEFINKYIYKYNKGSQIKKTLVEYENNQSCSLYPEKCCGNPLDCKSDGESINIQNVLVSSDNIINIKLIENLNFTLDDIKKAFYAGREQRIVHENDSGTDYEFVNNFEEWIHEFKNKQHEK